MLTIKNYTTGRDPCGQGLRVYGSTSLLDRIITASRERVASKNATNTQKGTPHCTIFFDCLQCICGTGRGKATTWWKQRGDEILICSDQTEKNHFWNLSDFYFRLHILNLRASGATAWHIEPGDDSVKSGRTAKTISTSGG